MSTTDKAELTVSKKLVWQYGFGSMFCTGPNSNFINYMFLFFMTDIAGIPAGIAATAYTVCSIIRPIDTFLSGVIIDATNLKWGKFRSWNIIAVTCTLLFSGALFLPYGFENKMVWCVVCVFFYTVATTAYNVNWTAHRSLVGIMSKTSQDNLTLVSAANVAAQLSGLLYGLGGSYLLKAWAGAGSMQYAATEYTWALLAFIGGVIIFRISKPYDKPRENLVRDAAKKKDENRVSFFEMLKTFRGPGLILFLGSTLSCIQQGFFTTLLAYFTKYVLGNPAVLGYAVSVNYAGGIVGSIIMPKITKGIPKKNLYIFGLLFTSVAYFCMYFFGMTGAGFLIIRFLIGCCGAATSGIALPGIGNDLADYYEMKGQSRARGFVQSSYGTAIYVGSFISSAVSSYALAFLGYEAGAEMTPSLLKAICIMMAVGPAVVNILAAIVMSFYKVDEKELDRYRKERAARNN